MNRITRHNYEIFFLDYLEGNLDAGLFPELTQFLAENPDLNEELEELKETSPVLETDELAFPLKNDLKKNISFNLGQPLDFETTAIARFEGDLNHQEELEFDNYLNNNKEAKLEYEQIKHTKLHADSSILFPAKSKMKRVILLPHISLKQSTWTILRSVAAILLLALIIWPLAKQENTQGVAKKQQLAVVDKTTQNLSGKTSSQPGKTIPNPIATATIVQAVKTESASGAKSQNQNLQTQNHLKSRPRSRNLMPIQSKTAFIAASSIDQNLLFRQGNSDFEFTFDPLDRADQKPMNLSQTLAYFFKKDILGQEKDQIDPKTVKAWEIAYAGFKGISKITGDALQFNPKTNEDGQLLAYDISLGKIGISKKVK